MIKIYMRKKNKNFKSMIFHDILNLDLDNIEESIFLIYIGNLQGNKQIDFDAAYLQVYQ